MPQDGHRELIDLDHFQYAIALVMSSVLAGMLLSAVRSLPPDRELSNRSRLQLTCVVSAWIQVTRYITACSSNDRLALKTLVVVMMVLSLVDNVSTYLSLTPGQF